jgi:hypothetical protein
MNLIFNSQKKIGLIVLGAALVMAGFLVFYDSDSFKKSLADIKKEKEAALQVEGFNLKQENKDLGVISSEDLSALLTGEKPPENLTQKFADNLAKGFIDSNPFGIQEGQEISVPDSQILLNQIANEQNKNIDNSLFVTQKELKISSNNSQENILSYYEGYKRIISRYSIKMKMGDNLEMFINTNSPDYLKLIPSYLQNIINELKLLNVPSDFSILHQDAINLFIIEKEIFSSLVNAEGDPLRAASALMIMEETANKFFNLDKNFGKMLENHGFEVQY